ncbi:MAG TPA: T9SS type A sorting domain-containing protein, partial [Clostridia bacterium]
RKIQVLSNEKILIGGTDEYSHDFLFFVKLLPDGSLDESFGTGGIVVHDLGGTYESLGTFEVLPNGKILFAGTVDMFDGSDNDIVIGRMNADGSLDTDFIGFGTLGFRVIDIDGGFDYGTAIAVQPDGKILVGGEAVTGGTTQMVVIRLNQDGTFDGGFGFGGWIEIPQEGAKSVFALRVMSDGKIMGAGFSNSLEFIAFRLLSNGFRDPDYDNDGVAATSTGTQTSAMSGLIQPDGKVVVGGVHFGYGGQHPYVVRFDNDGNLDSEFGTGGEFLDATPGMLDYYMAINQFGDRLYLAGLTANVAPGTGVDISILALGSEFFSLPVNLISFTAQKQFSQVTLSWKADKAVNFSHFLIERSTDGRNFSAIGTVNFNANLSDYSYVDPLIQTPVIQYRLKMIDIDGSFRYSPVATIRNQESSRLNVFPNPAGDQIQVSIPNIGKGLARVSITNVNGQVLYIRNYQNDGGAMVIPVNTSGLAAGQYYLSVKQGEYQETIIMLKKSIR